MLAPIRPLLKILRLVAWTFVAAVAFVAAFEILGLGRLLPMPDLVAFKTSTVQGWRISSEKEAAEALVVGLDEHASGTEPEPYAVVQKKVSPTTLQVDLWHWGIVDFSLLALRTTVDGDQVHIEPTWGTGAKPTDTLGPFCGCEQLHHLRVTVAGAPLEQYRIEVHERADE